MSTFSYFFPFVSIGILLVIIAWLFSQELRLRKFFAGKNGRNLEDTLNTILRHLGELEDRIVLQETRLTAHDARIKSAIRYVRTIRFNPYHGTGEGGNQSFTTALLDEGGNGVIVSTLYTRERTSVYGKPVTAYGSTFPLSREEQEVIDGIAKESVAREIKS